MTLRPMASPAVVLPPAGVDVVDRGEAAAVGVGVVAVPHVGRAAPRVATDLREPRRSRWRAVRPRRRCAMIGGRYFCQRLVVRLGDHMVGLNTGPR